MTLLVFLSPIFCASKTKKKKNAEKIHESTEQNETELLQESLDGSIRLPSQKRTYFYKIEADVLTDVENGSPESIRSAVSKLRKSSVDYEENEIVLINIATEIMKMVWPSQKTNWEVPPVSEDNSYIGAINSAKQGIFDSSTGNVDFLSTILPALVVLKNVNDESVYESCNQAINMALNLNPQSVLANYLKVILLEKKKEYSSAEQYITEAYNKSSTEELSLAYVRVLRNVGKTDKAAEILNVIPVDSNDINLLKQNAYVSFDLGDMQAAELYVAKVLQQNPNDLDFVLFRARILIEKNDYIHAVSLLDMYARQGPLTIDYLVLRAKVQLDWSKNTSAATETVEKAMQLYPDNIDALMFAARISSITDSPVAGKYADELASIVLASNPENKNAMLYALKGLIQRENWQEAYSISKKLIQNSENNSELVEDFVLICIKLDKKNEAYDFAKKQLDMNPTDENLIQSYVLAYSKVGTREQVLKYIESLMPGASAKMKSYLFYRRSYLQLTDENILADLRSSLISNPRNSEALFRLYEMYYAKKDYRKAQYYLRQVVAINPNDNSMKQLNEALTKLIK